MQTLMWISAAMVMSVLPIEKVRGKDLVMPKNEIKQPNNVALSEAISLNQWQSVSWFQRSHHWVIKAIDFDGQTKSLEPSSGKLLEYLSTHEIGSIAVSRHTHQVTIMPVYELE